ncbi:MAG: exo-alpha-sialidase, partial [Lentisphaeria bacterium]
MREQQGKEFLTFITFSKDGKEWTKPRDITSQVKRPADASYCSGPGAGILVKSGENKGRVIIPFNANGGSRWTNYLVYSDDSGENWSIAAGESSYGTNESQVVQISDKEFLINARCHKFKDCESQNAPGGWSPWNFGRVTRNRANIPVTFSGGIAEWGKT